MMTQTAEKAEESSRCPLWCVAKHDVTRLHFGWNYIIGKGHETVAVQPRLIDGGDVFLSIAGAIEGQFTLDDARRFAAALLELVAHLEEGTAPRWLMAGIKPDGPPDRQGQRRMARSSPPR
jgi:hypothetical protein